MKKLIIATVLLFSLAITTTSCREKKTTGDKIEEAINETGDAVEEVADEVEDAVE